MAFDLDSYRKDYISLIPGPKTKEQEAFMEARLAKLTMWQRDIEIATNIREENNGSISS